VPFYKAFQNCFDAFYLSHEINLRKPNRNIFDYVLNENNINANECLFIDDNKANCETASLLGIATWHIHADTEDVSNLLKIKSNLF
jgi:HAD superfamily hydrolase (TIGR01509 family)